MHELAWLPYFVSEVVSYGMAGGAGYLAWRLVRAYERRAAEPAAVSELAKRLTLLEDAVEQMDESLDQAVEAQQFTTRLLMGRGGGDR